MDKQTIRIPFPVNGVDESMPYTAQPELTCAYARNVRGAAGAQGRLIGGQRDGSVKAFASPAGSDAARRVTGLAAAVRAGSSADATGRLESVLEDWSDMGIPTPAGGTIDLRGKYVSFAKPFVETYPAKTWVLNRVAAGTVGYPPWHPVPWVMLANYAGGAEGNICRLKSSAGADDGDTGLAINYPTTNDITVVMMVRNSSAPSNHLDFPLQPNAFEAMPTNYGPFICGSGDLREMAVAYLHRAGDNEFELRIDLVDASNPAAPTVTRVTKGGITTTPATKTAYLDWWQPTLRLYATTTALVAEFKWPEMAIDERLVWPSVPAFLANPAKWAANNRGGALFRANSGTAYRYIDEIRYTRRVPNSPDVLYEILGSQADGTKAEYQLPAGWDALDVTPSTTTTQSGPWAAASKPAFPALRLSRKTVEGTATRTNRSQVLIPTAYVVNDAEPALDDPPDVEVRWRDVDGTIDDSIGAVFRFKGNAPIDAGHLANPAATFDPLEKTDVFTFVDASKITITQPGAGTFRWKSAPVSGYEFIRRGQNGSGGPGFYGFREEEVWYSGTPDAITYNSITRHYDGITPPGTLWLTETDSGVVAGPADGFADERAYGIYTLYSDSANIHGVFSITRPDDGIASAVITYNPAYLAWDIQATPQDPLVPFVALHRGWFRYTGIAGGLSFIKVQTRRERSAGTVQANNSWLVRAELVAVVNGTTTIIDTKIFDIAAYTSQRDRGTANFNTAQWLRWRDNQALNRVECWINGLMIFALDASTYAGDATKKVGLCVDGNSDGTAKTAEAYGGRIVRRPVAAAAPSALGRTDIVAFGRDTAHTGTLNVSDLAPCTEVPPAATPAPGLLGSEVEACALVCRITGIDGWYSDGPRNFVFAVDGERARIIDPVAKAITPYTIDGPGTFPAKCPLIAAYRGCIIMAGAPEAPNQWYMSATVGHADAATGNEPRNFDYGSTPAATRAYSGSDPAIGRPGDKITALVPFNDEWCLFGCARSMYVLDNHPGFGGRMRKITDATGILGPRAYCFDEQGNLYILGTGGLYVMPRGSYDYRNVSGRRLTRYLDAVDAETSLIQMVYDGLTSTVHVFITPRTFAGTGVPTVHVAFDTRSNALWIDSYPEPHGPTAAISIVGAADEDRRFLIGGWDGYIRRPLQSAVTDDGIQMDVVVDFAPLGLGLGQRRAMLSRLAAVMAPGSGPCSWYVLSAPSAAGFAREVGGSQQATYARTGTWAPQGREGSSQQTVALRVAGAAVQLRVAATPTLTKVAFEHIEAVIEPLGRKRGHL